MFTSKNSRKLKIVVPLTLFLINCVVVSKGERLYPNNPYSHREVLDSEGKFILEWIADPKNSNIVFNITAQTKGFVAIGFSKTGKMLKSDMVIGGVRNNRRTYLSDRYTTAKDRFPKQDLEQSWKLLDSWENKTHTSIKIMRQRETCDPQDFPIDEDSIHLLWAYGEDDVLDYHFKNRGSFQTHLLQPDLTPEVTSSTTSQQMIVMPSMPSATTLKSPPPTNETRLDVWRLTVTADHPKSGQSWCVFQQGPELRKKHNIIGFSTVVTDENQMKNLDRLVLYKCSPEPQGAIEDSVKRTMYLKKFEKLLDYSGECKNATDLYIFCNRIIYTWGKGGKDTFLPKNTGIPFGLKDEYYLLETFFLPHQSNGTRNQNSSENNNQSSDTSVSPANQKREIDIDIDLLLTPSPRQHEAKILMVGYDPMSPLIIPPGSQDFEVFGHCPNECTSQLIPKRSPIRVFGVSFDTGPKGKGVALHHFRNAFEIPLILENKNFDPSFQQMQMLRQETPVRPGDQLTVRCKFGKPLNSDEKSRRNSTPLPKSSSPRCLAYLWYYNDKGNSSSMTQNAAQNDQYECTTKIHPSDLYRWVEENAPQSFKRNIDFPQLLQNKLMKLRWTPFLRLSLYELYEFGRYRASCGLPSSSQQMNKVTRTNGNSNNNRNSGSGFSNYRNRNSSSTSSANRKNNGVNRTPVLSSRPTSSSSAAADATSEITVYPLPVEEMPYTMECPNLDDDGSGGSVGAGAGGPLLFSPLPGPVIFGFP